MARGCVGGFMGRLRVGLRLRLVQGVFAVDLGGSV